MNPGQKYRIIAMVGLFLLILTIGPTILAQISGPPGFVFEGFLLNPIDGATYLAKMFQGWEGDWKYTLAFTPEPGQGAYLFVFYLFLGHLTRLTHLSLIAVFHFARFLAIVFLIFSLFNFIEKALPDPKWHTTAFVLAAFASGMGWLAIPFGGFTSDFWVAEMYPFLSAYATPHFALGLGLLLWIITPQATLEAGTQRLPWIYALAALLLALISPFGVVLALLVLGSRLIIELWPLSLNKFHLVLKSRFLWVLIASTPYLLYDIWLVANDPVLASWNAQNVTPSPPLWDLLLSLSPFLWLAIPGAISTIRRKQAAGLTLVLWAGIGLLLVYFPFSLQRRFLMGILVPVVALAIVGLDWLARGSVKRFKLFSLIVLGLAIPTNLVVLLTGIHAIQTHDERIYMTSGEVQAFQWLRTHTDRDALILAGPQTGLLIPAFTGRRVIYGHPFETPQAEMAEAQVIQFYETGDPSILQNYPVQLIFYGPRETFLNPSFPLPDLDPVYRAGGVSIYASLP